MMHAHAMNTTQKRRFSADSVLRDLNEPQEPSQDSGWTMGYLDLLLLLLTMFAALLGITYMQIGDSTKGDELALVTETLQVSPPKPKLEPEVILAAYQSRPTPPATVETKAAPKAVKTLPKTAAAEPDPAPLPEITLPAVPPVLPDFFDEALAQSMVELAEPGLELFVDGQLLRVELSEKILFPLGSAELGEGGKELLAKLVDGLVSRDVRINVQGHTDDLPISTAQFPSNWELSSYRATRVARQLIELGLKAENLQVSGFADTRPRVPNDSPEQRALNRRVSLILHPSGVAKTESDLNKGEWRQL